MTTTRSPFTPVRRAEARRSANPLAWYWPKIRFVSTCPKCGYERIQHGYTRQTLFNLLNARCKIDGYCIVCNVCWPLSESERRAISLR